MTGRTKILNAIADAIEANLEMLAVAESWENGKPVRAFRMGRGIQAGRVWTNCYPAAAAFSGYKNSGVGRENHRVMLDHYSQTKCVLVSHDPKPLGF